LISATPDPLRSPCVLIVEDDERNLKLVRDVLQAAGFRTLEARAGAEAIVSAEKHLPDVILMDLRLPDMDGTSVARKLQAAPRTAGIPIVALSALSLEAFVDQIGFAGRLQKPIDIGSFPDQVRSFCGVAAT
jgi:two-component system, cell cycle response regulator DivK